MAKKQCKAEECTRDVKAKGYCAAHYQRVYRYGKSANSKIHRYGTEKCSVENCDRPHEAKGYCNAHYARHLKGNRSNSPVREFGKQGCLVPSCVRNHGEKGYCSRHAFRRRRQQRKEEIVQQFGGKCHDCKQRFPNCVFDFDNVEPDKPGHVSISRLLLSKPSRLKEELKRCEMVCANCHRIRTDSRREAQE